MIMTKEEIKSSVCWAANMKMPFDRDTQIMLMKTARERHLAKQKESNYDVD